MIKNYFQFTSILEPNLQQILYRNSINWNRLTNNHYKIENYIRCRMLLRCFIWFPSILVGYLLKTFKYLNLGIYGNKNWLLR